MPRSFYNSTIVLPLAALLAACGGESSGSPANGGGRGGRGGFGGNDSSRTTPVEVVTVSRGTLARTATVAGMLEPIRAVGVNSQLSGALRSVRVQEGDRVRQGQLLAEVDVGELAAQVRSAEATLEFAESTAKRSDELWRQRIITAAEFERDRAALASARASLEQLRTRLGYGSVRSPLTGVVTEKLVEAGDIVSPQSRLFTVADVSTLVSRAMVSELDVATLRAGTEVDVTVDALGGQRVPGRIRRIFPAADSATRLVPVEVAITGSALERLKPGYTVRTIFRLGTRDDVPLVPTRAVTGPAGAHAVFVVQLGKAERRPVRVGPDVDGRMEVLQGVAVGDTVVVAGNALLRDGASVRIVQPLAPIESPGV